MKLFIDRLIERVKEKNSHVCVGLDPHPDMLPEYLLEETGRNSGSPASALAKAVSIFNQIIIDHIADHAAAVKPQLAFYELMGSKGLEVLKETTEYARKKGLIVILDGKRNDIGSTAKAYAAAYLTGDYKDYPYSDKEEKNFIGGDALTVNPYLGSDGIAPFLVDKDRGAFALVRTSNPGAGELQDEILEDGRKLYLRVGELVAGWGRDVTGEYGYSNLGAVIGATYPAELRELRRVMDCTYFLIPGYGAQGGGAGDVAGGFNDDGLGALVNSARGIIFAYRRPPWRDEFAEFEFGEAAEKAVKKMKNEINEVIGD